MIADSILDEIGRDVVDATFHVGSISFKSKKIDSHFTLVPRVPENALWIRSESPLDILLCPLCGSELHAYDCDAYVVASKLTDTIYPVACSGNEFVIREDVARRLSVMRIPEMVIEPIRIKQPIPR